DQRHGNRPLAVLAGVGLVLDRLGQRAVDGARSSLGRTYVDPAGRLRLHRGARSGRVHATQTRSRVTGRIIFEKRGDRRPYLRPVAGMDLRVLRLANSANAVGQGTSADNESAWSAPHHGTATAGASRGDLCTCVFSLLMEQSALDRVVLPGPRLLCRAVLAF